MTRNLPHPVEAREQLLDVTRLEGENAALALEILRLECELRREKHEHSRTRAESVRLGVDNAELRDRCAHLTRWATHQHAIDERRIAAEGHSVVAAERAEQLEIEVRR